MTTDTRPLHFATRVIHAGNQTDAATGALATPIYATSTYRQPSPGEHGGFEYGRSHNPTRFALERCLADLESGTAGFAFASGLAATTTVLELLPKDSHLIALDDLYGGTRRLFQQIKAINAGLEVTYLPLQTAAEIEAHIRHNTRMIWIETPSNPLLKLVDLESVARVARAHGILTVADNTFATPWAQRPLEFGIDIVLHSATKYLNGHSDIIAGAVVAKDPELVERIGYLQNALGAILSPFDSFLVLRGLKTLALRMREHTRNALRIAEILEAQPKVQRVYYPGLPSHPHHALAKTQMNGYGGMVSCVLDTDLAGVVRFLQALRVFTLAESLGGVESLVDHPALMTHASVPESVRHELGITDGLVRFSVGVEDREDLVNDVVTALAAI